MTEGLIDQFTEHESRVSRFIELLKNRANLDALTKSYLAQIQDIEDALFEVLLKRNLEDAVGVQLQIIGKIVGQPYIASTDERFRLMVRARIAINLSHGHESDITKITRLLLVEGEEFEYHDEPPGQIRIIILDPLISGDIDIIANLIGSADAGGTRMLVQWNKTLADPETDKLRLGSTVGTAGAGGGLGSTTGAAGTGKLESVIAP